MNNCILWQDHPENHTGKHAKHNDNFFNSLIYRVEVDFNLVDFYSNYPKNPKNIGDKLRKRRMDLGLEQKEVAKIIGVTESSIWNWENGWKIHKKYIKRIEGFLGD